MIELSYIDNFIIISYLIFSLIIGLVFSIHKEQNSLDYFLAGKNLKWYMIGFSIFASSISGGYLIALTGFEISKSFLTSHFEIFAVMFLLLLSSFFAKRYIKSNVFTTAEFIGKRFDGNSRIYVAIFQIVVNVLIKIPLILIAGGFILKQILDWDAFTTTLVLVLLCGLYTVVGGLKAVVYTQFIQVVFLLSAMILLVFFGLHSVGWTDSLMAIVSLSSIIYIKPISFPLLPLAGLLLGIPILSFWYWISDQSIIQRILGAKTVVDAKKGTYVAILLKVIFICLITLIGLLTVKFALENKSDQSYSLIFSNEALPSGIKGVFIVGVFSLVMSSLSSIFNSTSSLFTMDLYRMTYPNASERKLVLLGRLFTTFTALLVILCVPLIKYLNSDNYIYLQNSMALLSSPIAALFVLGFFFKKINSRGAIWGLMIGGVLSLFKIVLDVLVNLFSLSNTFLQWIININFLYYAILIFIISIITMTFVSNIRPINVTQELKLNKAEVWK